MKSFPFHRKDLKELLASSAQKIAHPRPANSPGHNVMAVDTREGTDSREGANAKLVWGARSDVGLVREHNEDSFLVQPPLFAVCDGMGGHEAGEVASFIAVETLESCAPRIADDVLLGEAVEAANTEIIRQAQEGKGKPGMGCTASCMVIENNKIAIAHVGDSRIYLLHKGALVRLTHDHSFVEELVDAGEITADEARVHPSRSIITRALGSDPDMYADHFSLDVSTQDRLIICSDGLSSMIEDSQIESVAISAAHPQTAADNLVAAALEAGGLDNVSVIVVDVKDDGVVQRGRMFHNRRLMFSGLAALITLLISFVMGLGVINTSYFLAENNGTVGIYQGIKSHILGIPLYHLSDTTSVEVKDLPTAIQQDLANGLRVDSESDARTTIESYRDQIDAEKSAAAIAAARASTGTTTSVNNPATPEDEHSDKDEGGA